MAGVNTMVDGCRRCHENTNGQYLRGSGLPPTWKLQGVDTGIRISSLISIVKRMGLSQENAIPVSVDA